MAAFDVRAAIEDIEENGPDMTQAEGGGGFEVPAAGFVRLRFVGYYEIGQHEATWNGVKKVAPYAQLVFELSGPKHQPRVTENGTFPQMIETKVKLSMNERSNFHELFSAMNYDGKAKHIASLLGKEFVGDVVHKVVPGRDGGADRTFANLKDIRKPFIQSLNDETGEVSEKRVAVDPPLTQLGIFLWDRATPEMWDSIFIPGEYEAREAKDGKPAIPAKSKNRRQLLIKTALNWKGSPVFNYATGKVSKEDTAALEAAVGSSGADDLDGVV